tara:strand:- start:958 stop:1158 length:201 start_codon:yes stop_codon:yes gene_type:complete
MVAPALNDVINQLLDKLIILNQQIAKGSKADAPRLLDKHKQICKELEKLTKDQDIKGIFDEFRGYY